MNFNPPSFLKPQEYPDIPRSLDELFGQYIKQQQGSSQSILNNGFDATRITPQQAQQAQQMAATPGPVAPGNPLMDATVSFLRNKKAQADLATRGAEADISAKNANAFKDTATGLAAGLPKGLDVGDRAKMAGALYDDYANNPSIKGFKTIRDAVRNINTLAKSKTGIADLSIVYSLVKVLDPNSVVREGEIALSNSATPLAQRVATAWNNAKAGRIGSDEKNQEILAAAKQIYSEAKKGADEDRGAIAKRGLVFDPQFPVDAVLPPYGMPQAEFDAMGAAPGIAGSGIQTRTLKNGETVKVRQMPDGSFQEVP